MKRFFLFFVFFAVATIIQAQTPTPIYCDSETGQNDRVSLWTGSRQPFLIETLACGQSVVFWAREGGYAKVQVGQKFGYVESRYIRSEDAPRSNNAVVDVPLRVQPQDSGVVERRADIRLPRAYATVNGILQGRSGGFSDTYGFDQFGEQAIYSVRYPEKRAATFDVGAGLRLWRNVGIGAVYSPFETTTSAEIAGSVPHPFFFDTARQFTGTATIKRRERAMHLHGTFSVPVGSKLMVVASAGPSYFRVKRSVIGIVHVAESYPYDTVSFAGAGTSDVSKSAWGVNAGLDVSYHLTHWFGFGGMARFSLASFPLSPPGGSLMVDAGGFQAGVGLRVRLPRLRREE